MNKFERENVQDVYNQIYKEFDYSRHYIWPSVKKFLENIPKYSVICDIGCGNGKNMIYANKIGYVSEGFDISENLLDICRQKNLNVFYHDVLDLKLTQKYDKIIAIAILHHLKSVEEQILSINNLLDCLKDGGTLLVSFWSKEKNFNNSEYSKNAVDYRDFKVGPNIVDWKLDKNNTVKRFYYIHDYDSIINLVNKVNHKYIIYWEMQNWFIIFYK